MSTTRDDNNETAVNIESGDSNPEELPSGSSKQTSGIVASEEGDPEVYPSGVSDRNLDNIESEENKSEVLPNVSNSTTSRNLGSEESGTQPTSSDSSTAQVSFSDWRQECLIRLQSQASETLSHVLADAHNRAGSDDRNTSLLPPSGGWFSVLDDGNATCRRHATLPSRASASVDCAADTRTRAFSSAAPADTARQVSAISVEFQKLLEEKTAELRAERERGQLTDEQLEEQFVADIGAALREIADQLALMETLDVNASVSQRMGISEIDCAEHGFERRIRGVFLSLRSALIHVTCLFYGGTS